MKIKKMGGWRIDSEIKNICCYYRGPKFCSQNPHGDSQTPTIPFHKNSHMSWKWMFSYFHSTRFHCSSPWSPSFFLQMKYIAWALSNFPVINLIKIRLRRAIKPHVYSFSILELMNFLQRGRKMSLDIISDINLIMRKLIKFSYLNFSMF